ncbi:MAG: type I addiction module toxin, SymE family [Chitinophagaceae bacterium]|nr:MAG: type I addiction module toxin, SymE family [Chitinophagaceae bacterium]
MKSENEKKISRKGNPSTRLMKVYYRFRMYRRSQNRVPEIRLTGNWLERIGFNEGDHIVVSLDKRRIEICIIPEEDQLMASILAMDKK